MRLRITAVAVLCALVCGCASVASIIPPSREQTTLEKALAENRSLKASLEAETQLNRTLAYDLEVARINLQKANSALAAKGAEAAITVPAFQDYEVDHVSMGLLTGVSNWDNVPGGDGMYVNLLLKDSDGDTLKRKGNCLFELIDVSRDAGKAIMSWPVPAEVLGVHWRSFPPGFRVKLPWQGDVPYGDDCVFRATFTDAFGRTFTTSLLLRLEKETSATGASGAAVGGK